MRTSIIIIFLSFIFLGLAAPHVSVAQDNPAEIMSPAVETKKEKILEITLTIQAMVDLLHLSMYEAAIGDLSVCKEDSVCLRHAQRIKDLKCLDDSCKGQGGSRDPSDCFEGVREKIPKEDLNKLNSLFCSMVNSLSHQEKKKLFDLPLEIDEAYLVEAQAYIMAMNGFADKCENHIRGFWGEFGPKWDNRSYKALSGCRILAHQSTVAKEEKDFYLWYGTLAKWRCSNIINNDVRQSCHNSQIRAPRLPQDQSSDKIEALVKHLYLQVYDTGSNAELGCEDDPQCLGLANRIKPWLCLAQVCSDRDKNKSPADCFKGSEVDYPGVDRDNINKACANLHVFDQKDQQVLISNLPGVTRDELIEYAAYMKAINKSAEACREDIKRYIGADQSLWTYSWHRALSGCNILGKELNVLQEEAGYYIWYVNERKFSCSAIENDVLRQACNAPQAASPAIFDEK